MPATRGALAAIAEPPAADGGYTVVARRYRPQRFEDVVGQDHVVQALRNAIRLNRVTHAYLFSGTRGVGKTSIARIFAKCLNCAHGPTDSPDLTCDICQAIAVGQDVDVIEIDGASNNGVEQVRELRQNAGLRPSRSRFKIYYIDEVHMLSTGAFNALLKTLEEPPEHVKFFFATTEPNKIPVTVLSRCQRYDFAGISPDQIVATLAGICAQEAVAADPEALAVIARRAGGSMRDSQSLLEQLLSFGGERLTVELVQSQLGLASDERTLDLLDALADRDPARALQLVEATANSGVQPTELLGGAIEFVRDALMVAIRADVAFLAATPRQKPRLQAIADRMPAETLTAALQILADARGRLRGNPHGRILVETALLRVAALDNLADLGDVIGRLVALESGAPPPAPLEKKKLSLADPLPEPATPQPPSVAQPPGPAERTAHAEPPAWDLPSLQHAWADWATALPVDLASKLNALRPVALEAPHSLILEPSVAQNWLVDACERPEVRTRIDQALREWLGRPVTARVQRAAEPQAATEPAAAPTRSPVGSAREEAVCDDSLVKLLVEKFDAKFIRIDRDDATKS